MIWLRRRWKALLFAGVAGMGLAGLAYAQVPPIGTGGLGGIILVANSSGNVAAATATATLPAAQGKVTYITGFQMTAGGSTAVSSVTCTLSPVGAAGATLSYTFSTSATADSPSNPLVVAFNPPLPANAPNTTIVATCPALGAGNAHAAMSAQGFQR
jgi:hypothetical protein